MRVQLKAKRIDRYGITGESTKKSVCTRIECSAYENALKMPMAILISCALHFAIISSIFFTWIINVLEFKSKINRCTHSIICFMWSYEHTLNLSLWHMCFYSCTFIPCVCVCVWVCANIMMTRRQDGCLSAHKQSVKTIEHKKQNNTPTSANRQFNFVVWFFLHIIENMCTAQHEHSLNEPYCPRCLNVAKYSIKRKPNTSVLLLQRKTLS